MFDYLIKLIAWIGDEGVWSIFLLGALAFFVNIKNVVEFFEERTRVRIRKIANGVECEHVTDRTKDHLKRELATEHFKAATGMRLEKEFREAVIDLYNRMKGELAFIHFKRAVRHLVYEDGIVSVKVSVFDRISYYLNWILIVALVVFGFLFMLLPAVMEVGSGGQVLSMLGVGSVFLFMSVFIALQTLPVSSARKVEEKRKKIMGSDLQKQKEKKQKEDTHDRLDGLRRAG